MNVKKIAMFVKYETASYKYFCELSISSLSHCFHNRPKIQTTLVDKKKLLKKRRNNQILTIQRRRQHWVQVTERREKYTTLNIKKMSNTDSTNIQR